MVKIEVQNPIYAKCIDGRNLIKEAISFNKIYYRQGQHKKTRHEYAVCLMNRSGLVYTGLLDKVREHCIKKQYDLEIIESEIMRQIEAEVQPSQLPVLEGITLRPDQERLIQSAIQKRRGYLVAPTGVGKTLLALSIMRAFDGKAILFLVHSLSILRQTIDELRKHGFIGISMLGDGVKEFYGRIVVSTYQTFGKLDIDRVGSLWDVVICDEAHIAMKHNSSYHKILSQVLAPVRIGLTATPPTDPERLLIATGLIGPVIDEVTWEEGQELQILSEPKLRLVPVPRSTAADNEHTYRRIYKVGITENKTRNRIIISEAKKLISEGKSVLIFVTEIIHGDNLLEIAESFDLNCVYIRGDTDSTSRNITKKRLENRELDLVISTVIWREGVNVPSLGSIIVAGSGKSETALLQGIGRGLRRTKGKDEAIIVDFLDEGKYLSDHCVARLKIYHELGLI